jgi:hypothetical protein
MSYACDEDLDQQRERQEEFLQSEAERRGYLSWSEYISASSKDKITKQEGIGQYYKS